MSLITLLEQLTKQDARSVLWKNPLFVTDLGQLDCLGEVKGIGDFNAVMERSVELEMETFQLRVISIDALIEAMGRPRDLENVKILRALRER